MRRVSGIDAAFLYGETPSWHMHVSALLLVDPGPDGFCVDRLKRQLAARLHQVPQFRWRLRQVPFGLDRPVWIDDADFEVDRHVRRVGCPSPGGFDELRDLVGTLIGTKVDRSRPLWELWVIDGLREGQVALLAKVHHSIVDGISGSELVQLLFDVERDPTLEEPEPWEPEVDDVPDALALFGVGVRATLSAPRRAARLARTFARQSRTLAGFLARDERPMLPFQAPRTLFNSGIGPQRAFATAEVDLNEVRQLKEAFGVKLNDVVLCTVAGALRRFLIEAGDLPDAPLVAQVPVSTRTEAVTQGEGTQVGAMFSSLATDVADAGDRLRAIHAGTCTSKDLQRSLARDKAIGITETVSPAAVAFAARAMSGWQLESRTPPVFNCIVSNVPGPPFRLYVAGAELCQLYPMGPLVYGAALNVTVMSYRDELQFGFLTCRDTIPDPSAIADGVPLALKHLQDAAPSH